MTDIGHVQGKCLDVSPDHHASSELEQLESATTAQQAEDQENECENQQQMDPPGNDVKANKADGPENDKNNGDRPKHRVLLMTHAPGASKWPQLNQRLC